ncbi:MAG: VWA-like domain-containing protein [Myxococcales bacterium]|nr:VWA-like domain-containing protein [Polyangiaceae bacterium]MDW8248027.1 VWA-like domain-containing protein [Myxococcales bacterium]
MGRRYLRNLRTATLELDIPLPMAKANEYSLEDPLAAWLRSFVAEPWFLKKYPLYAGVLARMRPVADPSTNIMAVSFHEGHFYLHVNTDFFQTNPRYLLGVLLHEVHHIVLGHLTHPKFRDPVHPDLMEIALEISANEYIDEPLPGGILLRDYEPLGLRPHQSTIRRYERLVELRRQDKLKLPAQLCFVDEHRWGNVPLVHQVPVQRLIEDALADLGDAPETPLRLAGRTPQYLLQQLNVQGPPLPFDWKTALRMFTSLQRTPCHSYARPNRRFPGRMGEIPGRVYTSREVERPSILVALDTSGSMSNNDLEEIGRQLAQLAQHTRFLVAECDMVIHRIYPFPGRLSTVMGRGGTDLRPVFDPWLLRSRRVQGVVYFTDGLGPFPEGAPPIPVLWVLTGQEPFHCPWGQQVRLQPSSHPSEVSMRTFPSA